MDARTKIRLLRVLAYYDDTEFKDFDGARAFRRQALEMIEAALPTQLPEGERLEYLFVSAAYYREFGDSERSKATVRSLEQSLQQSKVVHKLSGRVAGLSSAMFFSVSTVPLTPHR